MGSVVQSVGPEAKQGEEGAPTEGVLVLVQCVRAQVWQEGISVRERGDVEKLHDHLNRQRAFGKNLTLIANKSS